MFSQYFILEALRLEYENKAKGEALALLAKAEAKAKAINIISQSLNQQVIYILATYYHYPKQISF